MDQRTIAVYEAEAETYAVRREVQDPDRAAAFAAAVPDGGLRLDLGCGPGHHLPLLGGPAVAVDAARSMVDLVRRDHPEVPAVRADLARLPFGPAAFGGVWSSKAHQHLPAAELPMALAEVHRVLPVGGRFDLTVFATGDRGPTVEEVTDERAGDDLPGRLFTWWDPDHLADVVSFAGFEVKQLRLVAARHQGGNPRIEVTAVAARALPDHVGAGMRLLCCGLNPSLHAADSGIGYVTASNRFWPAMAAAGLATKQRDVAHLLHVDRIGMTDLVHRPTARADELSAAEYHTGVERLARLCAWLQPQVVAMVGLAGWRAGRDRRAAVGWQPEPLGATPVYVLPSTSGLNARVPLAQLADHLRAAAAGPG